MENEILNIETESLDTDIEALNSGTPEASEQQDEVYRVFKTQEDFQRCIDKALGKRLLKLRQQDEELLSLKPFVKSICESFGTENYEEILSLLKNTQKTAELPSAEELKNELLSLSEEGGEIYSFEQSEELLASESFCALIKSGLSVKDAYKISQFDKILQNNKEKVRDEVIRSVRLGLLRPNEEAITGYGSFSATLDLKNLTQEQRNDIRERVRRGERITF